MSTSSTPPDRLLPTGTVTFLFTDIEGSATLAQNYPDEMKLLLDRHNSILRQSIEAHHGYVFQVVGDAFASAFFTSGDAISAALEAQRRILQEAWHPTPIKVRIGIHTGAAQAGELEDVSGAYTGYLTLTRVQRVMSAAHGGQVLLSSTSAELVRGQLPNDVTLRDMGEHRLKGLTNPERLWQLVVPDLPSEFPPLQSFNMIPNNLPAQATSLIGREAELDEIIKLLNSDGLRLLTLTGPGGTGKTRLSLQAAAAVLDEFPQGVWLVELAPVNDPQIVVQIVANVLAARETSGRTLQDALVDLLRYKTLLLVLDNCEHLIGACARLADNLLRACPSLKILASSREALDIAGETTFRVPSLSLPPTSLKPGSTFVADVEQSEAVRLFVERTQAVSPAFRLDENNALAVAQICRRLDGIPLAIELAAARIKVLTPAQIASRLDDRFRLLTGGSRTALPHQQTLKALIDWSWTLLTDSEKTLLRRLAVFAGGFTIESVESICTDLDPAPAGAVTVSQYEILDLLEGLVNKSLIQAGEKGGEAYFRLLETIRQYALDHLLLSGETSNLRDRHLGYFTRLAEEAEPHLKRAEMIEWIGYLERDADNLRTAMEWGLESCSPAALSLSKYLINYWGGCGLDTEGLRWLEAAIACLPTPARDASEAGPGQASLQRQAIQAYLLGGAAILTINLGKNLQAIQYGGEAERWARASGDQNAISYALAMRALTMAALQELIPQAKVAAEEGLVLARRSGDVWLQCLILAIFTNITKGDWAVSHRYQQENARLARQLGNPWAIAMSVYGLLTTVQDPGKLPEIRREMEEGIRLFTQLKNYSFITAMRSELAHILRRQGELGEAEDIYMETIPQWLELGNHAAIAHQFECLAALAATRRQFERAAVLLGAAQDLRTRLHSEMVPNERPEYEATLGTIRLNLDQAALQSAWSSGEAMGLEQAMAYALEKDKSK
jgi:predicted ATPase/class 3 adenylate cyclase